ncbi:GroES-like protein [Dentipellis sp. KUC8613]|nr:GroES-like protein [Dentipellis sp. KUC8613]
MSFQIPKTQKAAVIVDKDAPIQVREDYPVIQPEQLAPGECLVKLDCTGVCHTDLHAAKDDWPLHAIRPLIGGHEGVGTIVAIAANTPRSPVKLGDRVGIKWLADACGDCEQCRKGLEQSCPKAKYSGFNTDGTFAQYVKSWVAHVTPIPENLNSFEAASILCAGVTAYRAIKYCKLQTGDWIAIPGAGGGLGHLGVQYAKAQGLRVIAIDTGSDKKELCLKLGADKWVDFKETKDIVKDIKEASGGLGPHAAIIVAANESAYTQAVDYLRVGGTLALVGLPNSKLGASIFFTVFKSITIIGSFVGNRQDAIEAVDIAAMGLVKCHYAQKPLSALKDVYEGLSEGKVVGRVVLGME